MTNPTPTPRLVPDRPSDGLRFTDATIDKLQDVMAVHGFAVPVRVISDAFRTAMYAAREIDAAAPPSAAPAERGDVDAAIERLDESACNGERSHQGDEESIIRDELARLRNQVGNAAFMLANQEKYMRELHERLAAYERAEPIGQVHEDGNGERHLAWTVEDVDDYPAGTWLYTAPA